VRERGSGVRMIQNKQALFKVIQSSGLPDNLLKIRESDVPARLRYTLQNPCSFFDAFLSHPEMFPSADELLILWQTNGESIVGFRQKTGDFIRNYLEEGPEKIQILGTTYQQLLSELFFKLIVREVPKSELPECAVFLEFRYLEPLISFVSREQDWEDNCAELIAGIET
jgi:hypothetical protein